MSAQKALAHLEDAESALLKFMADTSNVQLDAPVEDLPDVMLVLQAVLRSVSRAAGNLETDE